MKIRIIFPLVIMLTAWSSIAGQTDAGLKKVTLYWFSFGKLTPVKTDSSRSSINFETGERGGNRAGFDLRYGGMVIGTPARPGEMSRILPDWLGVLDCRNMIVDLGSKRWQDFKETPPFPQPKTLERPRALGRPECVVDASAGRTDFSPYRQFVVAEPGNIYIMRLWRGGKVSYVMFRVESLVSRDNVVLTWKLVKPPNVDNEAF
jgi:hypothetical protein